MMKSLSDYMNARQTKLLNECGAFFCFSNKQFEEKRVDGVDYARLGQGLVAPKDKISVIHEGLEKIYKESIKQDIKDNKIDGIIMRELANYECQITGDVTDVVEALEDYPGIDRERILKVYKVFYAKCVENDWF